MVSVSDLSKVVSTGASSLVVVLVWRVVLILIVVEALMVFLFGVSLVVSKNGSCSSL